MKRLTFLLLLPVIVAAQTTSGPVLGWHYDPDARSATAILGIPGAARMSAPAVVPSDIRLMQLSPASGVAIALQGDSGWPLLYDLASGVQTSLAGSRAQPALAVWSPSGTALGLLYADGRWAQAFAKRDGGFELALEMASDATRLAVSDDGTAMLAASDSSLVLHTSEEMRVLHEGPYGAFTFLAGTTTPAFTTSSELRIADALLPLSGAVLLISARPGLLTAVGARTGDLTTFFASGDVLSRITCGCTAARIVPVGRAGSFGILRDSREGTLWIADFGRTAELYFVPRPAERVLFSGEHDAMN